MSGSAPLTGVLKHINKYLIQAKKIDTIEPVVAYYTRLYAISVAMKHKSSKADGLVIAELLDWCESHNSFAQGISKEEAKQRIETFALQIFQHADDEDRTGVATKSTANSFYSAYLFMEVCKQFGELDSDIQEKLKYSMWKTADITKAIKEGRKPVPGPPGGSGEENVEDGEENEKKSVDVTNYNYSAPPEAKVPVFPSTAMQPQIQPQSQSTPAVNPFAEASAPPPAYSAPAASVPVSKAPVHSTPAHVPHSAVSHNANLYSSGPSNPPPVLTTNRIQASKDADRLLRHAQSALSFDDFDTTIDKLHQALALLMPFKGHKDQ